MAPVGRPLDTSETAAAKQLDVYRRLGGAARVSAAFSMSALVRDVAAAGIRERHPEYDDDHRRRALCRLLWGDELVRKIWPDLPLVQP